MSTSLDVGSLLVCATAEELQARCRTNWTIQKRSESDKVADHQTKPSARRAPKRLQYR